MNVKYPQYDNGRISGASDTWDTRAGVILNNDVFEDRVFTLDPKQHDVTGFYAEFAKEGTFLLDPKQVVVTGFDVTFDVTLLAPLAPPSGVSGAETEPTVYAVLYIDDFFSPPSATQVKNGGDPFGFPALWAGSVPSPTISGTFDWPTIISGLSLDPGNYRIAMVWSNGLTDSNVSESESFTVTAGELLFDLEPKLINVTGSNTTDVRQLVLVAEPRQAIVTGFAADFASTKTFALDPKQVNVTGFNATEVRTIVLVAEPRQVTVTGVNTVEKFDKYLNLEPRQITVTGSNTTDIRTVVFNLEPRQVNVTGATTTDLRTYVMDLQPGQFLVEGYNLDAGTSLVFSLDSKNARVQGFDLDLSIQRLVNLEPKQVNVAGFAADMLIQRNLIAESKQVTVTGFSATLTIDRILPALAKQVIVTGFPASLTAERLFSLDARQVNVFGAAATFIGSYIYPDPQYVKAGVTYGPSGTDFTGTFRFNPSFDIMTGNFVTQENYQVLPHGVESKLTVLNDSLVTKGIPYGISQIGQSIGYLSYDVNTGRIANPVSENTLVVV